MWDRLVSRKLLGLQSRNFTHISTGPSTLSGCENFSATGVRGAHISETARPRKLKFYTHLEGAKYFFTCENISAVLNSASNVNVVPTRISETTRATKSKFYTHFEGAKYSFRVWKCFRYGRAGGGAAPSSVNLGPPHISGSIIARKLKFYRHFPSFFYLFHSCIPLPRLLLYRIYEDPLAAPSFRCSPAAPLLIQASHAQPRYEVSAKKCTVFFT